MELQPKFKWSIAIPLAVSIFLILLFIGVGWPTGLIIASFTATCFAIRSVWTK